MISFVNIFGLSVSLTLAIHLIVYVKFELSYDKFHVNHARIYRLLSGINKPGEDPEIYAISQGQFAREIKNIPEVEHYVGLITDQIVIWNTGTEDLPEIVLFMLIHIFRYVFL